MGITFKFPTSLEVGDCIAVIGEVGKKHISMRLTSDFEAFDPDTLLSPADGTLVGSTVPLLVNLTTQGEWEVIGKTPEMSSNASGFWLVKDGFRLGDIFICKIYVKRDHFEVHLNGARLSLSDHMIPISCIQGVVIEGDFRINKMIFGDTRAVEKLSRRAVKQLLQLLPKNLIGRTHPNRPPASVIECRTREDIMDFNPISGDPLEVFNNTSDDSSTKFNRIPILGQGERTFENPANRITSLCSLPSINCVSSYQIAFDVSDNEGEADDDLGFAQTTLGRALSCSNLFTSSRNLFASMAPAVPPKTASQGPSWRCQQNVSLAIVPSTHPPRPPIVRRINDVARRARPRSYHSSVLSPTPRTNGLTRVGATKTSHAIDCQENGESASENHFTEKEWHRTLTTLQEPIDASATAL